MKGAIWRAPVPPVVAVLPRAIFCIDATLSQAHKNPDDDPSLDTVKDNVHTGWYVGDTTESET